MAIRVDNQQDKVRIPRDTGRVLRTLAGRALAATGRSTVGAEICIVLSDNEGVRTLNRDYRHVDAPTDVLSFALHEAGNGEPEYRGKKGPELIGDVIISAERAVLQAEEYGHSFRRELAYLAVHGILHLLGYDHDRPERMREMRALEEELLDGLGMTR